MTGKAQQQDHETADHIGFTLRKRRHNAGAGSLSACNVVQNPGQRASAVTLERVFHPQLHLETLSETHSDAFPNPVTLTMNMNYHNRSLIISNI